MKCNKCGYDDSGSGDMAHVCQRPSFRYGEHPTSFGLFNPKQEPVAWMNDEGYVVTDQKWAKDQHYTTPLYTTPPQRKELEQEPVGEAYLCDRCQTPFDGAYECPSCGHHTSTKEPVYTTPPQRTWVRLTDEERKEIMMQQKDFWGISGWEWKCMESIEAKLKELNT